MSICTRLYLVRATVPTGLYLSFGNFLLLFPEYNLIASAMDIMLMLVLKMLVLKATCDLIKSISGIRLVLIVSKF